MKYSLPLIFTLLTAFLSGCIHEYPDEKAIDPSSVTVELNIDFKKEWKENLSYFTTTKSETDTGHDPFYTKSEDSATKTDKILIIQFFKESKGISRYTIPVSSDIFNAGKMTVTLEDTFKPEEYTLTAWLDECDRETGMPKNFNAEDLRNISANVKHGAITGIRECLSASIPLHLSEYANSGDTRISVPVTMTSPFAILKLVTTDVEQFLKYADPYLNHGEAYSLTINYESSIASRFDVEKDSPLVYIQSFEIRLPMPTLFSKQNTVFSDWFLVTHEEESVTFSLKVLDSAGQLISRHRDISVAINRGTITTLRGDFLTNFSDNTIKIDNIWDDDIIIEVE